jgi:hypothetical protein
MAVLLLSTSIMVAAVFEAMPMQHGCCKGRCTMAAPATPLVAVAPDKQRLDVVMPAVFPPSNIAFDTFSLLPHSNEMTPAISAALRTIQLRI